MAQKTNQEALDGLEKLIVAARSRLAANPDYIALKAFEKARAEIVGIKGEPPTPATLFNLNADYSDAKHPLAHFDQRVSQLGGAGLALEKVGHPLSAKELMDGAVAEGAVIGSNNPLVSFGSSLSKSDKFKSVRWKGKYAWWFSDRPLPPTIAGIKLKEAAE